MPQTCPEYTQMPQPLAPLQSAASPLMQAAQAAQSAPGLPMHAPQGPGAGDAGGSPEDQGGGMPMLPPISNQEIHALAQIPDGTPRDALERVTLQLNWTRESQDVRPGMSRTTKLGRLATARLKGDEDATDRMQALFVEQHRRNPMYELIKETPMSVSQDQPGLWVEVQTHPGVVLSAADVPALWAEARPVKGDHVYRLAARALMIQDITPTMRPLVDEHVDARQIMFEVPNQPEPEEGESVKVRMGIGLVARKGEAPVSLVALSTGRNDYEVSVLNGDGLAALRRLLLPLPEAATYLFDIEAIEDGHLSTALGELLDELEQGQ